MFTYNTHNNTVAATRQTWQIALSRPLDDGQLENGLLQYALLSMSDSKFGQKAVPCILVDCDLVR